MEYKQEPLEGFGTESFIPTPNTKKPMVIALEKASYEDRKKIMKFFSKTSDIDDEAVLARISEVYRINIPTLKNIFWDNLLTRADQREMIGYFNLINSMRDLES